MTRRRRYLAGALAVAFVLLTAAVYVRTPVVAVDDRVWRLSLRLRVDALVGAARVVTALFSPPVTLSALLVVAVVVSVRRRSGRPLLWAAVAAAAMAVVTRGLKLALARPGPGSLDVQKLNGAYPSGHTASLVVCGGAIVLLLGLRHVRTAWMTFGVVVLLVVSCLWYAHQHWLSDIVGSVLLSSVLLLWLERRLAGDPRRQQASFRRQSQGASWRDGIGRSGSDRESRARSRQLGGRAAGNDPAERHGIDALAREHAPGKGTGRQGPPGPVHDHSDG